LLPRSIPRAACAIAPPRRQAGASWILGSRIKGISADQLHRALIGSRGGVRRNAAIARSAKGVMANEPENRIGSQRFARSIRGIPISSTKEALMRAVVLPLVSLAGLFALAAPVPAAPVILHDLAVSAPAITMVRQRCGAGMKRANAWQDKNGAWHGPCVPKTK
jgi:hypothetical protein